MPTISMKDGTEIFYKDWAAERGLRRIASATRRQPCSILLRCTGRTILWLQPAGSEGVRGSYLELVAPGHDGGCQGALRRHRRLFADRLHGRPQEDHGTGAGDAWR